MKKLKPKIILLFIILIFALVLRLYKLNSFALFGDEVDIGYHTYSLLKTARDYRGNFLPTYIQSFSESRAPLLMYVSVPFIALFGLTPFSVRLVPLLFGILSLYYLYLLVEKISKNTNLALLCTLILSLTPWHIHYSRTSFEVTLLLSLILAGTYYFLENKHYLSVLLFCLTFYTYNTANIFTPLLVIYLYFTNLNKFNFKKTLSISLFGLILIIPIIYNILFGHAASRFGLISIFKSPQITDTIIAKRIGLSSSHSFSETLFHNKPTAYFQEYFKNYFETFSPSFLFINGDSNARHNVQNFGLILLPLFLPFIYGLLEFKKYPLFTFWLLTSPIASCLTIGGGHHPTRLFLLVVPIIFFIALGFNKLKPIIKYFILSLFLWYLCQYTHEYFVHYPIESLNAYESGYQELIQKIPSNYNHLFISNSSFNSLPEFLFYKKYNPSLFQKQFTGDEELKQVYLDLDGFKLNDNTFFISNWHHNNDIITKIQQFAQKDDIFVLFQLKEIDGDWDLSVDPKDDFVTLASIRLLDHRLFGQILQKK